ncbi:MAG: hypothetical protein J6Y79_01310 [Paludibacteraceae bacterium]|nr:hypothetical protein [Paludibacteraceae bacterium]
MLEVLDKGDVERLCVGVQGILGGGNRPACCVTHLRICDVGLDGVIPMGFDIGIRLYRGSDALHPCLSYVVPVGLGIVG